ncbi:MAG TPA: hypothetical protein VFB13_14190 [Reyranella sp.]|nr:hypothetical protein [Reyranella sp.]
MPGIDNVVVFTWPGVEPRMGFGSRTGGVNAVEDDVYQQLEAGALSQRRNAPDRFADIVAGSQARLGAVEIIGQKDITRGASSDQRRYADLGKAHGTGTCQQRLPPVRGPGQKRRNIVDFQWPRRRHGPRAALIHPPPHAD